MNESYNTLVADLKALCLRHKMVVQVDDGEIADLISTSNYKYPLIYMLNEYVVGNGAASQAIYKMHLLACSTCQNGNDDMLEVQSNMLGILMDICNMFENHKDYNKYKVVQDITYYPFFERFDDNLTGYRAEIYIRIGYNKSPCESAFTI